MSIRIKYITILLSLLLMSFLYVKANSIDQEKHNKLLSHFSQFTLIDSVLNQDILEIRQGLLTFYDPTVGKINQLKKLTTEIRILLKQIQTKHFNELLPYINKISDSVSVKSKYIESFKSSNAVFTNSLRYLPTATNQLSEKLPLDSQGDVVTLLLTEQLRDILIHNYSNDNVILDKFNETNKLLKSVFKKHYNELLNELNSLQSHANTVVINKKLVDDIVNNILHTPTSKNTNILLHEYLIIRSNQMQQINNYQWTLYSLSILLLLYIGYVLYRLNDTSRELKKTIKDLNYQKFSMDQHAIVSITDANGIITYANQKFCEICGFTSKEVLGNTYSIIKSDYHSNDDFNDYNSSRNKGEVWHGIIRNKTKLNEYYWVDTTCVPFMNEKGKIYQHVTIQTNISNIKDAQQTMQLQSAALEVAAHGIVITDKDAHILWVNKAFKKITGYRLKDVIGKTPDFLNSGKQDDAFFKHMWKTIADGQVWHGELINRRKDGSLYPEELTISPVLNSSGKISHYISIKQDISKRNLTEEALRRSQKMDAIGQLSGGIAHDFNNQLGIISGYLDMIQSTSPTKDQIDKYVTTATSATFRCIELTRQLLTFSRKQTIDTSVINLNKLLQSQQTIISRSVTPKIEVDYILNDELWTTETNAGEFGDAILNMVINARDAMPHGGKIIIETDNISFDETYAKNNSGAKVGDYVLIIINDTGNGMDKSTLQHVFEPFFSTKAPDQGTGLGMSMVYGYVKRYKGYIQIYSEVNIGTTIRFYLPRSNAAETLPEKTHLEDSPPCGDENILIVDDENDLLKLADSHLRSLGYNTYTASNAHQALEILYREKNIQLLFSDVVMPGSLNGFELAEKALAENPAIKILLTSGFTSQTISQNGLDKFSANLLSKPYRKIDLAERVRLVLDEK